MTQQDRRFLETPGYEGEQPQAPNVANPPQQRPLQDDQQQYVDDVRQQRQPDRQAEPPEAPAPVLDFDEVMLSRNYEAYGDTITPHLKFRKPNAGDMRKCGYPMRPVYDDSGKEVDSEPVPESVAKYIVALATATTTAGKKTPIPISTVDQFDVFDFHDCAMVVCRFFVRRR